MTSTSAVTLREANQATIKLTDTLPVGAHWTYLFIVVVFSVALLDVAMNLFVEAESDYRAMWTGLFAGSLASFALAISYRYFADEYFPSHEREGVVANWHGPTLAIATICMIAAGISYSYTASPVSDRHLASVVTQNIDNECLLSQLKGLTSNGYKITREQIRDLKGRCREEANELKERATTKAEIQHRLDVIEKTKQEALVK